MTRSHQLLAAAAAALVLSVGYAAQAQDTPEPLLACIANGTKVRHTYVQHADPAKLKEAVRIFETQAQSADYPEGTVIRMIPQEAMVKRSKAAFPNSNGWEYFALAVTPQGTTRARTRRRGVQPARHLPELSHRGGQVRLRLRAWAWVRRGAADRRTDRTLQAADPRCAK